MRGAYLSTLVVSGIFWVAVAGSANAAPLTVTGCLEKGHEAGEFRLSNATGGDAKEYGLVAGKGVDLNTHLGHKVEITGEKTAKKDKEPSHEHLEVSALKHLAAKCP
jgi:hypothetical protein